MLHGVQLSGLLFPQQTKFKKTQKYNKKKIDGCPSTDTLPPVSSLISAFSNNPALFPPFQTVSLSLASLEGKPEKDNVVFLL